MKEIKNKIYELTTLLNKYRKEYYELDAPTISDYEYDSLLHNLEQLADKMGVARQTISKWELGETSPDLKQSRKLSQIFNVSLNELTNKDIKSVLYYKSE